MNAVALIRASRSSRNSAVEVKSLMDEIAQTNRSGLDRYTLEHKPSRFQWKAFMRSTGTLGRRWLRRSARNDWQRHAMGPDVDLVTFWLDERIGGGGTGVCLSLFCRGYEVLRFDCFGATEGHFHIAPFTPWAIFGARERRLEFREQTLEEQVQRSLFEVLENLEFYLQLNPKRRVRNTRVDRDARLAATNEAHKALKGYLDDVPVLRSLAAHSGATSRNGAGVSSE